MKEFEQVSEEELLSVYGRGGGGGGRGGGGSSSTQPKTGYSVVVNANPPSTATQVLASLTQHKNDKQQNCDNYCNNVLTDAKKSVDGFSNPDGKTCAQHKASIQAAGNYVSALTNIPPGASAIGINDHHAFIVVHQSNDTYTVGNINGVKFPDAKVYENKTAQGVIDLVGKDFIYGIAK